MPDRSLRPLTLRPGLFASAAPRDEPLPRERRSTAPRGETQRRATPAHGEPLLRDHRPAPARDGRPAAGEDAGADGDRQATGSGSGRDSDGSADGRGRSGDGKSRGSGDSSQDDNPFAPPPEGRPDQPWQPRPPANGGKDGPAPWGDQWSDRQPGRSSGGFGERPRRQSGQESQEGSGGGSRWDSADPAQRRARYALLGGMWAFFFALFGWRYLALLLGALALYWGISGLRGAPGAKRSPGEVRSGGQKRVPDAAPRQRPSGTDSGVGSGSKPQRTAAVSGLVTASLALVMVAATFTAQLVYQDYYTCVGDALTTSAKHSCDDLLPKNLRSVLGTQS